MNIIESLKGGLIVSCQALPGEPLYREEGGIMVLMAKAALEAGAIAIRTEGIKDIKQIKEELNVPVIGLIKKEYPNYEPYITVTMAEIDALVEAKCDIIAMDATFSKRADGSINNFVKNIKEKYPNQLLMADISTLEEGLNAEKIGFDLIGTTMSGYTTGTSDKKNGPDFQLMKELVENTRTPIVAEGRIHTPKDLEMAFNQGVYTAVVGGAITRPLEITKKFINVIK
ncbi:N-acetylmannosamine-6-phosphate 2-epimerase [Globicatella sp. HMSC072A10]|uniref:N-acetylmannosamine-6-phosphate 2-epimerase n=1 Tax=Globicatella sp. HMSC072A10 TaxID=1739315 RepID=UPI0008C2E64B|nr:N-acetylmannosamine-6-phosphate 2-epimerase [Globicatella sp. HMSC072A10]OFK58169.1 N-acetylmannosamine-6-phosphate 2-epimerase [Globicatella sp. HMSC072A10]